MIRSITGTACLAGAAAVLYFSAPGAIAEGEGQGWGNLEGQVVKAGPVPEQKPIEAVKNHQDAKHCLAQGPVVEQEWVVNPKNHGVRWAFVWLQPDKGAPPLPIHPSLKDIKQKEVVIDQPACTFIPHALAMREGQVLIAKNSAPMPHNFKWGGNPAKNPGGNILIPSGKQIAIDNLVADRTPLSVSCVIHPWMKAWVGVFTHPYYAVTDADGKFEIKDAPAGNFRLVVWHDSGWGTPGLKNGEPITVKVGETTKVPTIEMK